MGLWAAGCFTAWGTGRPGIYRQPGCGRSAGRGDGRGTYGCDDFDFAIKGSRGYLDPNPDALANGDAPHAHARADRDAYPTPLAHTFIHGAADPGVHAFSIA